MTDEESQEYRLTHQAPDKPLDGPVSHEAGTLNVNRPGFIKAWMNKETPSVTETGFGYKMNCCTEGGSNVDPFAEEATDDNEWLEAGGPHLMMVVATADALAGLPTHPKQGGPWVMWRDTPYAHIMVPLGKHGRMHEGMHKGMHEKEMDCQ